MKYNSEQIGLYYNNFRKSTLIWVTLYLLQSDTEWMCIHNTKTSNLSKIARRLSAMIVMQQSAFQYWSSKT